MRRRPPGPRPKPEPRPKDTTDGRVPPRGPFNELVSERAPFFELRGLMAGPKCQLCRRRSGAKIPGEHSAYPERVAVLSVGPWAICEECVKVLDEVLGA